MALSAPPRPGVTKPTPAPVQYLLPPDFDQFADHAGYHAESDGRVYTLNGTTKSYVPPWIVWQNSDTGKTPDGQLTKEGMSYRIPGSDPNSAWNFMYEKSGPFRKGSQWDDKQGTYKGSIDWLTLLTTIGAGGVIGAGIAGSLGGGSALAGDVGASTTVPELGAAAPVLEGTAAGTGAASTAAGLGTAPIAGEAGTVGLEGATLPAATAPAGLPAAAPLTSEAIAPTAGTLPAVASSGSVPSAVTTGGATSGILSKSLSALSTPSVLSTIAQGAFGVYGASQAAGAQTDAAKIVADANTAAAKIQADASTEAARIQAESTKNALDFAKQGYNNEIGAYNTNQQQLSPYTGAGGAAVTKLSQLLGLGTPSSNVTPLPTVPITPSAPASTPAPVAPVAPGSAATGPNSFKVVSNPGSVSSLAPQAPASASQMVTLRAPTGEVTQKPASEAPHWIALGAQPVQQGATA
jgi:hypothetical protein